MGSPYLVVLMDFVDVKQHDRRAQELCKRSRGRPGFPYLIVLRVSVDIKQRERRDQDLCENRGGRPRVPILNSLHGLCGRKTT